MRIFSSLIVLAFVVAVIVSDARATHTCRKLPAICDDPYEARQRGEECAKRKPVHPIDKMDRRFDAKACTWAKDTLEVVSGKDAAPETFNETVLITPPKSDGPPCSGVLIAKRVVLTALHCFKGGTPIAAKGSRVMFGNQTTTNPALVRVVDASPAESPTQSPIADSPLSYPDIVLLRLNADAPAKPIKIALPQWIETAVAVRAVGFGRTTQGTVGRKLYGDLIAVSNSCKGDISGLPDSRAYRCTPGGELVAAGIPPPGTELATDTCNGDSGGPIFVVQPAKGGTSTAFDNAIKGGPNNYFLAGVTSRGLKGLPCGGGGIYTLTAGSTLAWIQKTAEAWGQKIDMAR